jgi:uncharacterized membrane protein
MRFANFPPLWLALPIAAAIVAVAVLSYRRPLAPLTARQRGVLTGLRALSLGLVAVFLCRPVVLGLPAAGRDVFVPVLVDVSRSMRLADAGGKTRLARAVESLRADLLPALSQHVAVEVFAIGDGIAPASLEALSPTAQQTDLDGAIAAIRDRYRGRRVSAIVLVSDGGDTGSPSELAAANGGAPLFTVGVGSTSGVRDREIVGLSAGDPRLDQTSLDLHVTAVSRLFGRTPFDLRLLANGRAIDRRRVTPAADGSPVDEVFTVSPDPLNPTVYTAEIAPEPDEAVVENNTQSILVNPAGRRRRILMIEGAPGFEHSFLTRALSEDPQLDLDTIVRKGKNDAGQDTFVVQGGAGRASALTSGFPARKEDLYAYDAVILANVESDFLKRAQLALAADFVSERGGGLLVLGGRSFADRSFIATPLEPALPVELGDRKGAVLPLAANEDAAGLRNGVTLTPDGEVHPIMRLGLTPEETRKRWASLPPLAGAAPLGAARPGAQILAVTVEPGGGVYPLVAVERYGRGRSMIFGGEASWRWRMIQPSTDRAYDLFWRQAARWLAGPSPERVSMTLTDAPQRGQPIDVRVDVRDAAYEPVHDATVSGTMTVPGGETRPLVFRRDAGAAQFAATFRPGAADAGLYHVQADARRGATSIGSSDQWLYVGGADREFADPRLNEATLRRLARATGGQYVRVDALSTLAQSIDAAVAERADLEPRDIWQQPWTFAIVIAVLSAEWILRRRWGLR